MATPMKTVPYTLYLPENIVAELTGIPIADKQEIEIAGLIFTGKNRVEYGQYRNQNLLSLLANFSSPEGTTPGEPPAALISNPLVGQIWHNQTAGSLYIYNGAWVDLSETISLAASDIAVSPAVAGGSDVQSALEGLDTNLDDHIAANPAHAASNISVSPAVNGQADAQSALESLNTEIEAHVANTSAHGADDITFSAYLSITSTKVQGAIQELKDELDIVAGAGITASDVSVSPTVNGQNDVQSALESLNTEIEAHVANTSAHAASSITFDPSGLTNTSATKVQTAISDLDGAITALAGSGGPETGSTASFTPNNETLFTLTNPVTGTPDIMQVVLENIATEHGYASGDFVILNPQGVDLDEGSGPGSTGSALAYLSGSNQIRVHLQTHQTSREILIAPATGTGYNNLQSITPGRWRAFVRCIKF